MQSEKIFAERFTELIKNSNLTLDEIAKQIGLKSKGTISKYASGNIKNIKLSLIIKIANLFNVSPIWLYGLSDEKFVKSDEAEHTKKVINEKVATTTEDGYTGDTVCEICGYEISKGKVVPMIKEEQKPQGDNKPQEQQKPQEDNKPQEQDKTENNTPQQQENSNKKEDNSTNPQTGDNVLTFGIIFAIATLGLASTIISKKKLKK